MSVYSYPQSKVIDQVTFKETEGGHIYAYLHAAPGSDQNTLQDILRTLAGEDWQVTPYNLSGKSVLEVRGFKNAPKFVKFLEEHGWATGTSTYVKGQEEQLSFKEKIKKRSLGASGAFYVIGDASFTKYGYADRNKLNMAGGMLYGAGTLSLLLGGRKDQSDLQVRDIAKKLDVYLKEQGATIPNECSLDSVINDHNKGLIQKADDLWRRYPSELMNLFFAAAGVCIATAAAKSLHTPVNSKDIRDTVRDVMKRDARKVDKIFPEIGILNKNSKSIINTKRQSVIETVYKNHKRENWLDIGLGTMTGLSGLFAMLVKEKKKDPDAPEKHGMAGVWEWIQEKPLAIAGVGYMVSTMCHAVSTAIAWNYASEHRRKSVPWRGVFVGANLVAELLLAISSKGHGEGVKSDKSVDNTIIALAADLIVKQPAKLQPALINHVAQFLGRPDVLAMKNEEVTQMLHSQVEAMRKNPWALASGPLLEKTSPPAAVVVKKPDLPVWQAKVTAETAAAPSPQLSA